MEAVIVECPKCGKSGHSCLRCVQVSEERYVMHCDECGSRSDEFPSITEALCSYERVLYRCEDSICPECGHNDITVVLSLDVDGGDGCFHPLCNVCGNTDREVPYKTAEKAMISI